MPTAPTADQNKYRQYEFFGARILEAREVNALQALALGDQPDHSSFALGALYQTGATLNMQPVFTTNTSCTLSPLNSSYPMFVFVNGRFEAFSPVSLNFPAVQTDGAVQTVYLNWVLWRVTANGANGSIQDATLIDSGTQESTANAAQLQLYLGADDSGPLNATTMIGRNTTPIPIMNLVWQSSALAFQSYTSANPYALGGKYRYGLLRSTTTTPMVAADDDPRLTDARNPKAASVYSSSVHDCAATGSNGSISYQDQTNTTVSVPYAAVTANETAGGVSANKVFYPAWGATVTDALSIVWSRITAIFSVLAAYGSRLTALEGKPTVDYSWHVGQTLGLTGVNRSTHPPVIDNNNPDTTYQGFVVTTRPSAMFGSAYSVTAPNSLPLGLIDFHGDYVLVNADYQPVLQNGSADFRYYSRLAAWAQAHRSAPLGQRGVIAGGALAGAPLDTHDPTIDNRSSLTQKAGFQVIGSPQVAWDYAYDVKDNAGTVLGGLDFTGNYQYRNPGTADNIHQGGYDFRTYYGFALQMLSWLLNQQLQGSAVIAGVRPENTATGGWFIITFGTIAGTRHEVAFGGGQLAHGENIVLPAGFSGITVSMAAGQQHFVGAGQAINRTECYMTTGPGGLGSQMFCRAFDTAGVTTSNIGSYFAVTNRYFV